MKPVTYKRAVKSEEAISSASVGHSFYLAGGTTLIDLMKLDVVEPEHLIDINKLSLADIELKNDAIRVGALVKNSDLAHHPLILEHFPVLSQALLSGASPQLRNMATVGGNIMQRTRCYYFRDTTLPCNKREPGSGCPAIGGHNRIHAILGGSDKCIAVNPSDMCVALAALDASVNTVGPSGKKTIPLVDFHVAPGEHPNIETVLDKDALIESITIPLHPRNKRSHYLKVRDRASYAFALVSAAVALELDGEGVIKSARVGLGGVATKPWRALEAEKFLVGKKAGRDSYRGAGEAAVVGAKTYEHNAFKVELTKRVVVRALEKAEAIV
ncbi:MAG TPA: xanthine dehydrogenase family protein subunit M [Oculatellaceae cyanobacterium]